jgi:hypothetical protein
MATLNYAELVKQGLTAYATLVDKFPHSTYNLAVAFDDVHQQYLVRKLGWKDNRRVNYTPLHVALRNGKIWIEEDMTEDGIATYFLEQGVPREDIVLAFHPPFMRPLTEFAVA